jgi:hypothetical protein
MNFVINLPILADQVVFRHKKRPPGVNPAAKLVKCDQGLIPATEVLNFQIVGKDAAFGGLA